MRLTDEEFAALKACAPALRRCPDGFVRAPFAASAGQRRKTVRPHVVRQLVQAGLLLWGNAAKSFVTPTAAGRDLLEAADA